MMPLNFNIGQYNSRDEAKELQLTRAGDYFAETEIIETGHTVTGFQETFKSLCQSYHSI